MSGRKYFVIAFLALFAFFPLITYIWAPDLSKSTPMPHCIFCDIVQGRRHETNIVENGSDFVIFADIKPASKHHYLAVSKNHISSIKELSKADHGLLNDMQNGLKDVINSTDGLYGFHVPPFTSIQHLHMHGISPRSEMGFFSRIIFKPGTWWFKTVEEAQEYIDKHS